MRANFVAAALRLTLVMGVLAGVLFGTQATALAHPDLDRGVERAEEADFDGALSAFGHALDSGTLTRDELVVLLYERALVLHAVGQREALARDLENLAMIDPRHDLDRRAPPEFVQVFERASARQGDGVAISASCETSSTGLRISAEVRGLSETSLGKVIIQTRKPGAEKFAAHRGNSLNVVVEPGESLLYSAQVVGVGSVVLASDGNLRDPKVCEAPSLDENAMAATPAGRRDSRNRKLWWWIGAGGALVVTAVTVGIVVSSNGDRSAKETSVGSPMVSFE